MNSRETITLNRDVAATLIPAGDTAKAREFWSGLFGWQWQEFEGSPTEYHMTQFSETTGGAIYGSDGSGAAPRLYFDVDDINAANARVRELGGEAGDAAGLVLLAQADHLGQETCLAVTGTVVEHARAGYVETPVHFGGMKFADPCPRTYATVSVEPDDGRVLDAGQRGGLHPQLLHGRRAVEQPQVIVRRKAEIHTIA